MSVLSTSAKGASFLILFQLASRGFTFFINQILLRFLSPETLGLSAQLDLYARTVISFARDSIEVAAQRQANDAQPVVNLAYLAIAFGAPLAYGLASIYLKAEDSGVPHFSSVLWIYAASCVVELCAAPAYAVAQQRLLFKVRASAETVATVFRCLSTCAVAIWASKTNFQAGVLPFAAGQLSFALGTLAIYLFNVAPIAKENKFSLLPTKIPGPGYIWGYLSEKLCRLSLSLFVQNSFKYVLTQGDGILIAALASLGDQGAYALASNYGGLIARMLFQPIEETSRTIFAQLCATPDDDKVNKKKAKKTEESNVRNARSLLENILKFYSIIGLVACTIGPTVAPILLRLVAGPQWADTQASSVLVTYCYYIPLLAINGVTEAFVTAVASNSVLHIQSAMMGAWFVAFGTAAWLFMHVMELGARGLVLANCVNMVLRICFNTWFFSGFFKDREQVFDWTAIAPNPFSIAAAVGTWSILHSDLGSKVPLDGFLRELVFVVGVSGVFGALLLFGERKFLLQWVQSLLRDRFQKKTK